MNRRSSFAIHSLPLLVLSICAAVPSSAQICVSSSTTACVLNDRISIEVDWTRGSSTELSTAAEHVHGMGRVVSQGDGYAGFALDSESDAALLVKILDDTPNEFIWIFAAGATDLDVRLRVHDTVNDILLEYENPAGQPFATITDTAAFPKSAKAAMVPTPGEDRTRREEIRLADASAYIGFDVSPRAVEMCRQIFRGDDSKRFLLMHEYRGERAELALSLDVIYHLIEDEVFESYLHRLFDAAERFVIIYSSNSELVDKKKARHVRHRNFSSWVDANRPDWTLFRHIPNRYPLTASTGPTSPSDFYIYEKRQNQETSA